jgi:hypothetical protein
VTVQQVGEAGWPAQSASFAHARSETGEPHDKAAVLVQAVAHFEPARPTSQVVGPAGFVTSS